MSLKPETFASQITGFICSAGTAVGIMESDIIHWFYKILLITISGVIGGAASVIGKMLMKKWLNRGIKPKKEG